MTLLYRFSLALLLSIPLALGACAIDQDDDRGADTKIVPMGGPDNDDDDADVDVDAPDAPDVDIDAPDAPDAPDIDVDADD